MLETFSFEEHVFSAAKADTFGTESTGHLGIAWNFGVGAHAYAAELIDPFHKPS